MLSALLVVCLWQDPKPAPKPTPVEGPTVQAKAASDKSAVARQIVVEPWDDARAKLATKELSAAFKGKSPSMAQRSKALEALATASNKAFVKPLAKIVEKDKSVVIRRRAAQLLGNQPAKRANKTILKLVGHGRVESYPTLQADVIRALTRCGYTSKQWKHIGDLFEREYALDRVPVQEAILELVTTHKEKQAIPILLRNLDEPGPSDVHGGNNPPAEYWEARWKSWKRWRPKVKEALFAITGQRFSTAEEARIWLDKNKLK